MPGPFRSKSFIPKVSRVALLAPFMLLAYSIPASALTYEAKSKIDAVTVYLDRAKIERTFEIDIDAGAHEIVVPELPEALLPDSLRISAQGPEGLVISSADLKRVFAAELIHAEERRLLEEFQALRDETQSHDDTIAAARLKLDFIRSLSQHAPMGSASQNHSGEDSAGLQPESWQLAWTLLSDGTNDALRLIRTAEAGKRTLAKQQQKIQRELSLIQSGARASSEARIKLESANAGMAKFTISYQQHGASWRPIYDARLKSDEPQITLVQRAEVRQQTGEDWRDVALTLSTARPGHSSAPVELPPWVIDFQDLKPLAQKRAMSELRSSEDEAASVAGAVGNANAPAESFQEKDLLDAVHREANLVAAPFTANYRVPGRAHVAADNSPANFLLGEDTFQANLSAKTVPAHQQVAYLIANYTIERDSPYLPGRISLFRDGTFVGTNWLPLVRPGEEIETAFGVDDRIKVEYRMVKGERSSEGLLTRNQQTERRYKMVITNLHDRAMPISVVNQLPVSRDERIEVELLRSSSEPSERNPDDREGLLVWNATYEPGESRDIDFGYRVIFPEGLSVAGF